SDGWGYMLNGYYTVYMVDSVQAYKDAGMKVCFRICIDTRLSIGKISALIDTLMRSKGPLIYTTGSPTKKRLNGSIAKSRSCGLCRIRPGVRMHSNGKDRES